MIPLFTSQQVRAADSYAINKLGMPGIMLMENAAISIKNSIFAKFPHIKNNNIFGIVCGKGNNGGDGFALARQLLIDGFNVIVISLGKEIELKGDALINYEILTKVIKDYDGSTLVNYKSLRTLDKLKKCDVIVDALLGTGSKGELREPYNSIVKKLNKLNKIKIAIDVPTGLSLENANGTTIFNADLTVTLAELKAGLFYEKGYANSGKIVKGSIGIGEKYFDSLKVTEYLIEPEDALNGLPKKEKNIEKYSAGKVLIIAGSGSMPGAAIFTTNAAMVSGAGAGFLAFPKSVKTIPQKKLSSAIVLAYNDNKKEYLSPENIEELTSKINWADVIAIGPGLGREKVTIDTVREILTRYHRKKFIIDADAIFALRNSFYKKLNLQNKILTPHHKEFADLLGIEIEELKQNILKYGKLFVKQTKAILVLKGAPTIIFSPKGDVFINTTGNSGMAKFGTGDVLTGIITAFVAQNKQIENSTITAVYTHSLAADIAIKKETVFGLTPEKLTNNITKTIRFLRNSFV